MKIEASKRLVGAGRVKELLTAESIREYMNRLDKMGIKELGSGKYSVVFQHPTDPNVVVKLLAEDDPDYINWVKFCKKNKGNPYLPKIIHLASQKDVFDPEKAGRYSGSLTTMHLVFMEKLEPLTNQEYAQFTRSVIDLARPYSKKRFLAYDFTYSYKLWEAVAQQKKDLNLAACAAFLAKRGKAGAELDVHAGNVMKRGKQPVIIDPFAS